VRRVVQLLGLGFAIAACSPAPVAPVAVPAVLHAAAALAPPGLRLPGDVAPVHYDLHLAIDPASDAFFYAFDDRAPREPQVNAATCYTGGINRVHRNAKLKLFADIVVKDGEVTYQNVKISPESTITDKTLVDCMVKEVEPSQKSPP